MKSQLFTQGGGAGIGSRVIVLKNGVLQNVRAEVIRGSYDSGENLYLSIIDDSTEEALLPLTGYVDNDNVLHLSGRDFDDNKTYEFTIDNTDQSISLEEVDGVTIGETTISTEGGSGDIAGSQATATITPTPTVNINGYDLAARNLFSSTFDGENYYPRYVIGCEECPDSIIAKYPELEEYRELLTECRIMFVEDGKRYMKYMSGSDFLPVYNKELPQNSLWVTAAGEFLKPQWNSFGGYFPDEYKEEMDEKYPDLGGINLYVVTSPFALKSDIPASSKQYRHLIEIKAINPYEPGGENYDNVAFSMITSLEDPIASYSAFKTFVAADNNANKYVMMQNCMINVGSTSKTYGGIIGACQVSGSILILAIISGETTLQANINPAYQVEFTDEVYEL